MRHLVGRNCALCAPVACGRCRQLVLLCICWIKLPLLLLLLRPVPMANVGASEIVGGCLQFIHGKHYCPA